MWTKQEESRGEPNVIRGLGNVSYEERLRKLGLSHWEKRSDGDSVTVFKNIKGGYAGEADKSSL